MIQTKTLYHWQKKAFSLDTEYREILRMLSNSTNIFLDINSVCSLVSLPRQEALDSITELEEAGWLTYGRKLSKKGGNVSNNLFVAISERVARRQLTQLKFKETSHGRN